MEARQERMFEERTEESPVARAAGGPEPRPGERARGVPWGWLGGAAALGMAAAWLWKRAARRARPAEAPSAPAPAAPPPPAPAEAPHTEAARPQPAPAPEEAPHAGTNVPSAPFDVAPIGPGLPPYEVTSAVPDAPWTAEEAPEEEPRPQH